MARRRLKPWERVVIPFNAIGYEKWLAIMSDRAMLGAVRDEVHFAIGNIRSGRAPGGQDQIQNKPDTVRKKGHGMPLIGKQQTFITPRFYKEKKVEGGWELRLPSRARLVSRMGYIVDMSPLTARNDAQVIQRVFSGTGLSFGGGGGGVQAGALTEKNFTSLGGGGGSHLPQPDDLREAA